MKSNRHLYRSLLITFVLSIGHLCVLGQNIAEQQAIAARYIHEINYPQAAEIYFRHYQSDSNNIDFQFHYANILRLQNKMSEAYPIYAAMQTYNLESKYHEAYYHFGELAKQLGQYKMAIEAFQKYINTGESAILRKSSEQEIKACNYALAHAHDSSLYEIIHLPPPINGPYSEFNPRAISDRQLVFSRYEALFAEGEENVFGHSYFSEIYTATYSHQGWQKVKLFDSRLSANQYFTGNICFNKRQTEAYFTRCVDLSEEVGPCSIYWSKKRNGKWSKAKALSASINLPDYSATQPYLAEFYNYKILFFSANRPNGFGGFDIWYAVLKGNEISELKNAGSLINTSGDELSPFYDSEERNLYFSSNKQAGFGGFDIFKSNGELSQWTIPDNLGQPINSPFDDLYYSHYRAGKIIYLSSNRKGSYFHDQSESCCGDIYVAYRTDYKDSTDFSTFELPIPEQETSTQAKIQKLLPLTLYFDNDMPDPRSTQTETKENYKDLLARYLQEKEQYVSKYSDGLEATKAKEATIEIETFYNDQVALGFENLELFAHLLKQELEAGKKVRIKIKGYASPLNSQAYNLALSKRRISSLKNFIYEYENGYFAAYLNQRAANGGSLHLYEDPLGDSQSIGLVSDNANDLRNSVYSPTAALQRKIQIIMYSSNDLQLDSVDYPIIAWQRSPLNLGTISKTETKTGLVSFKNIGKAELNLQSVQCEDDFVQIQLDKSHYQSGENGKFYFLIRPQDLSAGDYSISIQLQSNQIEENQYYTITFCIAE
jgi:outer membrane protein OmpA-like peptidoglycan-associated protein